MVQMNQFAGQKLRHRCREQTYGHQGGKAAGGGGGWWWCDKKNLIIQVNYFSFYLLLIFDHSV